MIEIKHKITGEVLKTIEAENLIKADLSRANLTGANLSRANLCEADLTGANLSRANLSRANLLFCKMDKRVFEQITEEWFE
jgi:uncharacterized protein YjbI with pentapeptide repeats